MIDLIKTGRIVLWIIGLVFFLMGLIKKDFYELFFGAMLLIIIQLMKIENILEETNKGGIE